MPVIFARMACRPLEQGQYPGVGHEYCKWIRVNGRVDSARWVVE